MRGVLTVVESELREALVECEEKSVTVAVVSESCDSWRVWEMVRDPAVEGRACMVLGSHL